MREVIVSNCEKNYLIQCLENSIRLDGRAFNECRDLKINFGRDWGCCHVNLGKTSVIAQVSCEVQQPNTNRPGEGLLNINIELNPIAAPHFEAGRQSDESIQLNRLLDKCLKDSKAIDLESLCIKSKEKVWAFRVDINVLNHEGNILDCASVAALAALAHFRRPDITFDGEEFTINTYDEKDPIPTVIHHHPVCVSYAIFNNGDIVIADPTALEEGVAEGQIYFGLNNYKELCGLHLGGSSVITPDLILQCATRAAKRANTVIQYIKKCLEEDKTNRIENKEIGFHLNLKNSNDVLGDKEILMTQLDKWIEVEGKKPEDLVKTKATRAAENEGKIKGSIEKFNQTSGTLFTDQVSNDEKGTENVWEVSSDDDNSDEVKKDEMDVIEVATEKVATVVIDSDEESEEEEVVIVHGEGKSETVSKKRKKKTNK